MFLFLLEKIMWNPACSPDRARLFLSLTRSLQGLYPSSNGVPPSLPRPTIVLIVRNSLRGLANNDEVRCLFRIADCLVGVQEPVGQGFREKNDLFGGSFPVAKTARLDQCPPLASVSCSMDFSL